MQQTQNDRFFLECQENLPPLSVQAAAGVDRIKQRHDYHRIDGLLLEGTINVIVVAPLLEVAGFLDPPYQIRSPHGVDLELGSTPQYDVSRTFSLFPRRHELGEVVRILDRLGQTILV
jgi:hypothetical protein